MNTKFLYLFNNQEFIDEIAVINHDEEEIKEFSKELKDKNGPVRIFLSDKKFIEPKLEHFTNEMAKT